MKKINFRRSLSGLFAVVVISMVVAAPRADAGETAAYLKSGWFTWDERLFGRDFVKEQGLLHAAGVARKDDVGVGTVGELLEVWGGMVDYDGHDVRNTAAIKADTIYLGTKEELSLGVQLGGGTVRLEPFGAVGHKFWVRTRSGEDWNLFYGKAGVGGEARVGSLRFYARGGAFMPIYTRNHVSLSGAGLSDVVVEPKSRVSAFAEGGVKFGALAFSVEYEKMRFGESEAVATRRLAGSGAVIVDEHAFQPASESTLVSVKVAYGF